MHNLITLVIFIIFGKMVYYFITSNNKYLLTTDHLMDLIVLVLLGLYIVSNVIKNVF